MITLSRKANKSPQVISQANVSSSAHHFVLIDILRGLAALSIVVYHARVDLWVGFRTIAAHPFNYSSFDRAAAYLSAPVPFFRSGVMLFFLISGFCIHYPYVAPSKELHLRAYAIRRWFRIYPPYLIAVLFTVLVEWMQFHVAGVPQSDARKTEATVLMFQNYMHDPRQMAGNGALWSLPVEVELYLLYPFFLLLTRRTSMHTAFLIVLAVSTCALVIILGDPPLRERYASVGQVGNALMYWVVWCGGALLAERVQQHIPTTSAPPLKAMFLAIVIAITAMLSTIVNWPIETQELLWAAVWFFVIGWGLKHAQVVTWLPHTLRKWLAYLGMVSYSLYLVHFPFFKLCSLYWLRHGGHPQGNFLVTLLFCILAVPVATGFYFLFERPFHLLARYLAQSPVYNRKNVDIQGFS